MQKYVCQVCRTEKEADEIPTCDACGAEMELAEKSIDEDIDMDSADEADLEDQ